MYRNGHIDKETRNYMKVKTTNPGKVKANPKMHKPGHPIRTIISGIGHATEPLAEFAELELEENVTQLNSYIRDTPHFLRRVQEEVQQPLPEGAIIFCMDVRALYPSVPRKEGMIACKQALDRRKQQIPPTEDIMEAIDTVLDNNHFEFAGQHYIQTEGTAIGSKLGMNYACTYMGTWENDLLCKCTRSPYTGLDMSTMYGEFGHTLNKN
ncbi:uncharacterized protein [Ptychodera flava]|uniref:uncharacterized protein n=1 Tax=Ptychodera flava TaxID=63121 RepID=UPI00396A7FD7